MSGSAVEPPIHGQRTNTSEQQRHTDRGATSLVGQFVDLLPSFARQSLLLAYVTEFL